MIDPRYYYREIKREACPGRGEPGYSMCPSKALSPRRPGGGNTTDILFIREFPNGNSNWSIQCLCGLVVSVGVGLYHRWSAAHVSPIQVPARALSH